MNLPNSILNHTDYKSFHEEAFFSRFNLLPEVVFRFNKNVKNKKPEFEEYNNSKTNKSISDFDFELPSLY